LTNRIVGSSIAGNQSIGFIKSIEEAYDSDDPRVVGLIPTLAIRLIANIPITRALSLYAFSVRQLDFVRIEY